MRKHASTRRGVAAALVPLGILAAGCSTGPDDAGPVDAGPTSSSPPAAEEPPALGTGRVTPGTYRMSVLTADETPSSAATLDVPDGFVASEDWYVATGDSDAFLGLWTVGTVDRDACRDASRDAVDPGPGVDDLVAALTAQRSTRASAARPASIDGHDAVTLELVSADSFGRCDRFPALWRDPERPVYGAGQVDRLWVLEVDGTRVVVDAAYGDGATAQERASLRSMVRSLHFV